MRSSTYPSKGRNTALNHAGILYTVLHPEHLLVEQDLNTIRLTIQALVGGC